MLQDIRHTKAHYGTALPTRLGHVPSSPAAPASASPTCLHATCRLSKRKDKKESLTVLTIRPLPPAHWKTATQRLV